ncbi:MAG: hypothetical protein HY000_25900 [Planctomycetes bacterium]|nr:hypothetical protein [Planctomycetota bacterium]
MNNLCPAKRLQVLHLLVEGNSIRSVSRLTGVHKCTVAKHLVAAGAHCQRLLDRTMRRLMLEHLELDEIWTFVRKKQGRIPPSESYNTAIGDQYVFIALDQKTKLIPTFAVGKRDGITTDRFIQDLYERLAIPVDTLSQRETDKPQISTDGWRSYRDAIDMWFARSVRYGQIVKDYKESDELRRYGPPSMIGADRRGIFGSIDLLSICTSHVERNNLTIRTFVRRFTRLSLGFSKKLANLIAAVALHVAHYNFCRVHSAHGRTPAMKANVTGHVWSLEELLAA